MKLDEIKLAVIGLGYVGLPLAVEFAKKRPVTGYDINAARVAALQAGEDRTREVSREELREARHMRLTTTLEDLRQCNVFIVTVPTPIDERKRPDLGPLLGASAAIGTVLSRGAIVIYESTVYPGCTEEDCVPVLEQHSGLRFNQDFFVGYCPERINPGDKNHRVATIKRVTSGSTPEVADVVDALYRQIVTAGTHQAPSIKVAEASKVIENTQRDVNISLMNELSLIFARIGIDTLDVLEAAGTKWNFLPFRPGLVGGHCIGVDPYYLTDKAQRLGYLPQVILSGRLINDNMGRYIARTTVKKMIQNGIDVTTATVGVLGVTFKENCPDIRNSRVVDIVRELRDFGIGVVVDDPQADAAEVAHEYPGIDLRPLSEPVDALIVAVAHDEYASLTPAQVRARLRGPKPVVADIKAVFPQAALEAAGITVWRL